MRTQRNILDLSRVMKKHPWQPVKVLAQKIGCHKRQIQKWLPQLESVVKKGPDPITGRANVLLFALKLPVEKQKALKGTPAR